MRKLLVGLFGMAFLPSTVLAQEAPMPPLRPDQVAFRALYKELVETNTTLSSGSCTRTVAENPEVEPGHGHGH
jgi:hypothetical protein